MIQLRVTVLDRLEICAIAAYPFGTVDVSGVARLIRRSRVLLLMTFGFEIWTTGIPINFDAMVACAFRHVV